MNDDGMRLRVRAMLKYMSIKETPQPNKGRIHINKQELIEEVKKNKGKVVFDLEGYTRFKEEETTANKFPDVNQTVRARFRPAKQGEGPPGTFIREGGEEMPPQKYNPDDHRDTRRESGPRHGDSYHTDRRDTRRSGSYGGDDRGPNNHNRPGDDRHQERRSSFGDRNGDPRGGFGDDGRGGHGDQERRGSYRDQPKRASYGEPDGKGFGDASDRRSHNESVDRRGGYGGDSHDRRGRQSDSGERRGSYRDYEPRNSSERRTNRDYDRPRDDHHGELVDRDDGRMDDVPRGRFEDRDQKPRSSFQRQGRDSAYYGDVRRAEESGGYRQSYNDGELGRPARGPPRDREVRATDHRPSDRDEFTASARGGSLDRSFPDFQSSGDRPLHRGRHSASGGESTASAHPYPRQKRVSDSVLYLSQKGGAASDLKREFASIKEDPDPYREDPDHPTDSNKKRSFDDYQKQQPNRGYNIEPSYSKRRSV
jgi:hypothetical protein